MHTKFWSENLMARDHLEDVGEDGKIILECILGWDGVELIHLAKDRGQWWALTNIIIYLWVS